jgi:hypothetical protein
MNRKQFLQRIGLGVAVAAAAPVLLSTSPEDVKPKKLKPTLSRLDPRRYPLIPDESQVIFRVNDRITTPGGEYIVTIVNGYTNDVLMKPLEFGNPNIVYNTDTNEFKFLT